MEKEIRDALRKVIDYHQKAESKSWHENGRPVLLEIRWTLEDKPMVRRADGQPLTDRDRQEVEALLCFNCGAEH